jgi:uncharacterized protein YrrD
MDLTDEKLGKIDDVIFDSCQQERFATSVVDTGGWLTHEEVHRSGRALARLG